MSPEPTLDAVDRATLRGLVEAGDVPGLNSCMASLRLRGFRAPTIVAFLLEVVDTLEPKAQAYWGPLLLGER